jgi:predicted nucleic acid-binding protein
MSVVIDANLVAALLLPLPYSEAALEHMAAWKQAGETLLAPALMEYELVTALRRALAQGMLDPDQADIALGQVAMLNIESIPPAPDLHRRALVWAGRLGQSRAYDGQYLAVAEAHGATFWTGDRRLANGAGELDLKWVRWVGTAQAGE